MTTTAASDRQRWLALYVLCAGMLMIVLDGTIVNVALPSIQEDLGFSQSNLAWVVNAYLIPFGGLLLLAGRLGDLLGQRRVFLVGLAIFTVASALCAASPDQGVLIGARFIQGIGGALSSAVILAMIVRMFQAPNEQAKAIGVYGFVASAGGSIGLLLGGILTQAISWHFIFVINLPIGVLVGWLALRLVDNPDGLGMQEGADFPGAALITGALMLGVFTILQITTWGWVDPRTIVGLVLAALLLVVFVRRQSRIANPLMPLRLFSSRNVVGANTVQALLVAGMFGMFFLGALYLEKVLGYSALEIGLAFLPTTLVMGGLSLGFSEKLIMRFGPRNTLIPGFVLVTIALLLFARTPVDGNYLTDLLPPFLLIGIGIGTSFPSIMTLAMSGATPQDAGLASGLVNTSMQVGGAVGLAVLATLSTERTENLEAAGHATAEALNSGYHLAYLVGAGLAAVSVLIAVFVLRPTPVPQMGDGAQAGSPGEPSAAEG
ncbi:MAG TPA: MFS transporter [Solirubrobacterales bacterium]|nr:MFS transporter [Solirubrobacterales bacterium]